jgi:sugar/nucleoside kinase (ribokinase family)
MSVKRMGESHMKKLVYGKHVLVSLGQRGVVWFGPNDLVPVAPNASFAPSAEGSFGMHTHWMHFPAAQVPTPRVAAPAELVTNGAGDAFCGGFMSSLIALHKQAEDVYAKRGGGRRQTDVVMLREYYVEAIRRGLLAAANKIYKNSLK